jgi:hypothetical protein
MIFDQADLERHMSLEKSFVSALPRKLQGLVRRMADLINLTVVGDGSIGTLAANGDATGAVSVGRAATAFLHNGMKVEIDDGNSAAVSGYVQSLDTNAGTFTLKDAATGGSAVDLTNYTTAQSAKVYLVNGSGTRPTSLVDLCFSAANGGADSLYSGAIVKSASPIYQPFTEDISASNTGATLLASLYDVMFAMVESGRDGMNSEILVPFNAYKAISKQLETNVNFEKKDEEKIYGSTAITIIGPDSELKIRTARGVPAGKAMILNYDAVSIASYGELIQKGKKVGAEHFEVRNTTGYQMIVDKKAEFEVIGHDLSKLGGVKIATSF